MKLTKLLKQVSKHKIYGDDVDILGLADDSRKASSGFAFIAIKGEHVDGNDYVDSAIEKGAVAIISERLPQTKHEGVSFVKVEDAREALGLIASAWYGNPSKKLKVIGVTGSDGKTTTSHLIYEILKTSGRKVGLISSIAAKIGNISVDTGFHVTNPEPLDLHKYLHQMVKDGTKYVVLETTSHGIAQKRIAGIEYDIAVLTNITHEHLDYHKTFENYRDTKLKLFENAHFSVLNKDDKNYKYFVKKLRNKKISYSLNKADIYATDKQITDEMMSFVVHDGKSVYQVATKLLGDYNVQNILAAICATKLLKVKRGDIQKALANADRPKGRLEKIKNTNGINIYIDFAHTPNSLQEVLTLLASLNKGRLIVVFGCASERDDKKRPIMGKIATDIADISIFTAEDPRREDINKILSEIESGIMNTDSEYYKIPERGEAITTAIHKLAQRGDTVVICGKAHETSMSYDGVEYPWSDFEAVELALKGKTLRIKRK